MLALTMGDPAGIGGESSTARRFQDRDSLSPPSPALAPAIPRSGLSSKARCPCGAVPRLRSSAVTARETRRPGPIVPSTRQRPGTTSAEVGAGPCDCSAANRIRPSAS